jgi:hypothetical protein
MIYPFIAIITKYVSNLNIFCHAIFFIRFGEQYTEETNEHN